MVNDVCYSPELLPGIGKKDSLYQASGALSWFKDSSDLVSKFISILLFIGWLPAYLYRWSIKSTAWFYFPLAILGNNPLLHKKSVGEFSLAFQTRKLSIFFNVFVLALLLVNADIITKDVALNIPYLGFIFKAININIPLIPWSLWFVWATVGLFFILWAFASFKVHISKLFNKQPEVPRPIFSFFVMFNLT